MKSKEESLQRAQMVASSTSPSYCPARTGLSFFKLAAGWGEEGKETSREEQGMRCRESGESSETQGDGNQLGGKGTESKVREGRRETKEDETRGRAPGRKVRCVEGA